MTLHRLTLWAAALLVMAAAHSRPLHNRLPGPPILIRIRWLACLSAAQNLDEANQKIFDVPPGRRPDGVLSGPLAFAAYNRPSLKPCMIFTTRQWQDR
jgi:hypothetical protein